MKKKAFKKMLAGVSAVAMLGTAMPMTLIADAYSYNNMPSLSTGFTDLFSYLDEDGDSSVYKSPLNATEATSAASSFNVANSTLNDLGTYDYKLKKYEKATTPLGTDATAANAANYYATAWDTAAAKADLLERLKDKDVTDLTFYTNPKNADGTTNTNYGKIDTITINMPVVKGGTGATSAENVEYKAINFKVVRNASDLTAAYTNKSPSLEISIILAANITDLGDAQTTHLNNNVNLNLNGHTLTTNFGYQVNNKTLRVWNGTLATAASTTQTGISANNNAASVLTTYGSSFIELYDGVNITRLNTGNDAAAISGAGKLVFAGEAVISNDTAGAAISIDNVNNGDYTMYSDTVGGSEIAAADLKATTTTTVKSGKNHAYNKYGIEVTDRGVAQTVIDTSTKYLDADARTTAVDYAYQPVDEAVNGEISLNGASLTVGIDNIGELYWLSQYIAKNPTLNVNSTYTLTIEIDADLDGKNAVESFTPIDASGFPIAKFDGKKHTISNLDIVAETGNAAIFSKTKGDASARNEFTQIRLDAIKATAKEEGGLVAALVAEGNKVNINKSFVINPTLTGTDAGAFASKLNNGSTMSQTYAASKYDMVFFVSDETTQNELLTKTSSGTALTAVGKTNYYVSDFTGLNMTGHGPTYFNGELKLADFKSGKAAFLLNKHEIKAVGGSAGGSVVEIADNVVSTNIGPAQVNGGTAYEDDIFGQTIGTNNYPVFATATGTGKNIVYRQIEQTCKGENAAWTLTNAVFANTQVKMSAPHKDADGDGVCDVCTNAYNVEVVFDPCLHESFKDLATYTDGWVRKADVADDGIVNTAADMTAIDITLTKDYPTVESVLAALRTDVEADKIKGWDVLTGAAATGNNNAGATIVNVNFEVNDSIICKVVDTDDITKIGYKIASDIPAPATTTVYADIPAVTYVASSGTNAAVLPVKNEVVKTTVKSNGKADAYVIADNNVTTDDTNGVDRHVSKNTATFTDGTITFQITFLGGVKHNVAKDKTGGAWDLDNSNDSTDKEGSLDNSKPVYVKQNLDGTHSYAGTYCDCAIETEDCKATYDIVSNTHHKGQCSICGAGTAVADGDGTANTDEHNFEAMFTSGEFTVKRCRECGYVTFSKDTSIFVSAPVIEKLTAGDATFRQKYSFNIAAGDNTIVSYGVLYTKDGTPIDAAKIALNASNKYFNATGAVVPAELGDVKVTTKKTIKTNGTYNVNISLENADDSVNICGYVIYQKPDQSYAIEKTAVVTNSFRDLAVAEIENNNGINYEGKETIVKNGVNRWQHKYAIDVEADYAIKQLGIIYSKAAGTPVTNDTTLADLNTTIKSTSQTATSKSVLYRPTFAQSESSNTMRGYVTIEYKGIEYTLYTDFNGNS